MNKRFFFAALAAAAVAYCLAPARDARATVTTSTTSVSYVASGSTGTFSVPFPFANNSDLVVTDNGATKTLTTHYTVGCAGCQSGGTVVFAVNPTAGHTIKITRVVPLTQPFSARSQGQFRPASYEAAFDWSEYQIQQLQQQIYNVTSGDGGTSITIYDEGASQGAASSLNCVGDAITCSVAAGAGTVTDSAPIVTKSYNWTSETFAPDAGNTDAITATGHGSGNGVTSTGGATSGSGGLFTGGAQNGAGVSATGVGSGAGVSATGGNGNGNGVTSVGSAAGYGISASGGGGAPSLLGGVPTTFVGNVATAGDGARGAGLAGGVGVQGTGGATGVGLKGIGGATSGDGVQGTSTSGNGGTFTGGTNGKGIAATGAGSGNGVGGIGGTTSGAGGSFTGGAPNGLGITSSGTGDGNGITSQGGNTATGDGILSAGVKGIGGSGSSTLIPGPGGYFIGGTGGSGNSNGVRAQGTGGGAGLAAYSDGAVTGGRAITGTCTKADDGVCLAVTTFSTTHGQLSLSTPLASAPSSASNGEVWSRGTNNQYFETKANGVTYTVAPLKAGTCTLGTNCATITMPVTGMVCSCGDNTAAAACKSPVSGTTLTITGTGTDVISYTCMVAQ